MHTDAEMDDVTEWRRCGDDNELWACFGCSDWYCADCLGGEMQVIDQAPPDPEKWKNQLLRLLKDAHVLRHIGHLERSLR